MGVKLFGKYYLGVPFSIGGIYLIITFYKFFLILYLIFGLSFLFFYFNKVK